MEKMIIKTLVFILMLVSVSVIKVAAETTNAKHINNSLSSITINEINIDRETAQAAGKLSYEKKFIETSIHYINGTVVEIQEREITESEYNMTAMTIQGNCTVPGADDCWETASKIVSIAAWPVTGKCNTYRIQVDNVWKTGVMPTVRSYDVIAIRHSTSFNFGGGIGYQYYKQNGVNKEVQYDPVNGTNTKKLSNGVGTSMNIVDDATSDLHLMLLIEGSVTSNGIVYFGGTYQHATSTVTLTQSQNYTISTSGLGGVLAFNSSVIGKYDGMQGVSGSFYGELCNAK